MNFHDKFKLPLLLFFYFFQTSFQSVNAIVELAHHLNNDKKTTSINIEAINFDLKEVMSQLLENFPEKSIFPEEFMRCYQAVLNNSKFVKIDDLITSLRFIIDQINTSEVPFNALRAPRPDAPDIDISPVGSIITCDLNQLNRLLEFLFIILINCCNELEEDFTKLFNDLLIVKNNINIYCLLITDTAVFIDTFTTIMDIKDTLTTCCAQITIDFQDTWTIISAGFSNTFTEISDLNATLTACCQAIQINFEGTFTALSSLTSSTITCTSACNGIPIIQSTVITAPGFYCLAADITGPITINASNVTIDLSNHTISGSGAGSGSGIIINTGSNRVIKNGSITNFDRGIFSTDAITTQVINCRITNCAVEGITSNNGTDFLLEDLIISTINGIGVHVTGNNDAYRLNNVTVNDAQQGFIFDEISNSLLQNCQVADCSSALAASGYEISAGNFNQFNNCSVKNLFSSVTATGFLLLNCANTRIYNCTVYNVVTDIGNAAIGFECSNLSNTVELINCSVLTLQGPNFTAAYDLQGNTITVNESLAQSCIASNLDGNGFICTGSNIALTSCQAYNCQSTGFTITTTNITLQYCQSAYNNIGFLINNPSSLIGNSVAVNNSSNGFESNVSNNAIYHCFASDNGINNYLGVPNVQNADTQVNNTAPTLTGPFAGANLFI